MNKYLLLRDNKQSGPYSAGEIIEKGIKPYDLVWLEGKSAAWRYPSEIEELKAHAPAAEEQPFDRFYKKAEQEPEELQSRFVPKPVAKTLTDAQPSKKVYINFPGGQKKMPEPAPVNVTPASIFPEENKTPDPVIKYVEVPRAKKGMVKGSYIIAMAAVLLLVLLVSYFLINNNNRQRDINELNALVQQLEQRAEENRNAVSAVSHEVREKVQESDTVILSSAKPVSSKSESAVKAVKEVAINAAQSPVNTSPPKPMAAPQERDIPQVHENLFNLVSVKSNKYKTGVLGGISNLQLELTNNSLVQLHKVTVEIQYLGPEKKMVRTQTVYFENIHPGSQSTIDVPKSNRGVTINCIITDIKS